MILVEGFGGFGKSVLLQRFADIASGAIESSVFTRDKVFVARIDWQDQRDRRPDAFSVATGPQLLTVLVALHGAIVDEARRVGILREVQKGFRAFVALVARAPELTAQLESAKQDAEAASATRAQQIGAAAAIAKTVGSVTPAAPVIGPLATIASPVSALAANARRRHQGKDGDSIDDALRVEEALVRTFADGVRELSRKRAVVLLLDTYEIVANTGRWLREASRQTGSRAIWVLAGRLESEQAAGESSEASAFRRELPEGKLRIIPMTAFGDDTVRRLLSHALGTAEIDSELEAAALNVTRGIPLAVRLVARMLLVGRDLNEVLRPVTERGDGSEVVRELAERYLKHVREDAELAKDAPLLYGLALLHGDRSDPAVLRALWDESRSPTDSLASLSQRHDFVLTATRRLHQEVRDTIRSYLLDSLRRDEVRAANQRACNVIRERLDPASGATIEQQLSQEAWRASALAMLWHTFWVDNQAGLVLAAEILPSAVMLQPALARDVVEIAGFFADTFSADEHQLLRGFGTMLSFGPFLDGWLARRRTTLGTLHTVGPFARLREEATSDDRDAALALTAHAAANGPTVLAAQPPLASIAALLRARSFPADDVARLSALEEARELPPTGPFAREVTRIAAGVRDTLRVQPSDAQTYVRAAVVDDVVAGAPGDADSLGSYAVFMKNERGDFDQAERLYERAIAADPVHANNLGNFASFMRWVRRDHDRAEELYARSVAADPKHANHLGGYATLVTSVRGEHDRAQELYEQALVADSAHPVNLGNYAVFLSSVRGDYDRAEELYERAVAADPGHANNLGNFASFMRWVRRDHDRAEELYARSVAADPGNANHVGGYAGFMTSVRGEHDRAQEMYERAVSSAPSHAGNLGGYASFLWVVRGEHDRAQSLFERALTADPVHAVNLGSFAVFMRSVREDHDRAQDLFELAVAADPTHGINLGNFAEFMQSVRADHDRARDLYEMAIAANPDHAGYLGGFALFAKNVLHDYDRAEELYERAIAADPLHAVNLPNYAWFRASARDDPEGAVAIYERALEAHPSNCHILGAYASFLESECRDEARAEELYGRAIRLAPDDANNLGNYAALLLARGADDEAFKVIATAFEKAVRGQEPLLAELWMYLLCLGDAPGRSKARQELASLVTGGVRSPGWDFTRIVARAGAQQHPDATWLAKLAAVICDEAPETTLAGWPEWGVG